MNVDKAVSRNPFWDIIKTELHKNGYHHFHPEQAGNHSFVVVIEGLNSKGQPHKAKYHFPKIGRSFESTLNFKSTLRNFIKQELPNRGFFPKVDHGIAHRVRQPGMFIAKINHDVEKKQLATPKPILQALGDLKSEEINVVAPPYIPEDKPQPQRLVAVKPDKNELVSDNMVLAVFLVDKKDLSLMSETCSDIAKFRGSKPAPLRLLSNLIVAPPLPVVEEKPKPVQKPVKQEMDFPKHIKEPVRKRMKMSMQDSIVRRMKTKPTKEWRTAEFFDLGKFNSVGTTLSLLATAKRIKRVGIGRYMVK